MSHCCRLYRSIVFNTSRYLLTDADLIPVDSSLITRLRTVSSFIDPTCIPDNEKSERRTIHPLWAEIQQCGKRFGPAIEVQRSFKGDTPAKIEWFIAHISGCIASVAARLGIPDREDVFNHLEERIKDYCPEANFQDEFFKRRIKLGKNPETEGVEYGQA